MTCCGLTKLLRTAAWLLIVSPLAVSLTPLVAQTAQTRPYYDLRQEVTFSATVSSVPARTASGNLAGSHLLLATGSGTVDASLGRWGLHSKTVPAIAVGQQIQVSGVMKVVNRQPVLIVRTLRVGGQFFTVRNEHGIPVSPQARERAGENTVEKGDSL